MKYKTTITIEIRGEPTDTIKMLDRIANAIEVGNMCYDNISADIATLEISKREENKVIE